MWVGNVPKAEAEERAMQQLKRVRIAEQAGKYPLQLSGGQQQRVPSPAPAPYAQNHVV
jgi:general L-amino acid transport system ATP-binding protein